MADDTTTTETVEEATEATEAANESTTTETAATEGTSSEEVARIRAALAKANKEAERLRLKEKEREDAQLSEIEKAKRDADEAKIELEKLRSAKVRADIALELGLPAKWMGRLQGDTEDELRADAAEILADLNKPKKPAPDASQGARTSALSEEDQFFESIYGKQA
ncbi:hypothetical protein [Paenarthrobacter sp. CAP02]|uniref:hypothetical protein n=1 Tax=Paenarthrobacter sp. CAP02 TaxID=3158144 RepID=UPI0032DB048C